MNNTCDLMGTKGKLFNLIFAPLPFRLKGVATFGILIMSYPYISNPYAIPHISYSLCHTPYIIPICYIRISYPVYPCVLSIQNVDKVKDVHFLGSSVSTGFGQFPPSKTHSKLGENLRQVYDS